MQIIPPNRIVSSDVGRLFGEGNLYLRSCISFPRIVFRSAGGGEETLCFCVEFGSEGNENRIIKSQCAESILIIWAYH